MYFLPTSSLLSERTGSVILLPTKFKTWKRSDTPFVISAHSNEIADLAFSPFNDDLLVTAGRDNTVKVRFACKDLCK